MEWDSVGWVSRSLAQWQLLNHEDFTLYDLFIVLLMLSFLLGRDQKAPFLTFCMGDCKGPFDLRRIVTMASPLLNADPLYLFLQ
jgi:hypothetical protein